MSEENQVNENQPSRDAELGSPRPALPKGFAIINEAGNPTRSGYYNVLTTDGLFPNYMNTFERWWDNHLRRWCQSGLDRSPVNLTVVGWKQVRRNVDDDDSL